MNDRHFWLELTDEAQRLSGLYFSGREREVFDSINELMEKHRLPFCFDIWTEKDVISLIFSPEGDLETASAIDTFTKAAPTVPGWSIQSRRSAKGPMDVRAILRNLYFVDPADSRFMFSGEEKRVLKIFLPERSNLTREECVAFGDFLLWHAFGEGLVMTVGLSSEVHLGIPEVQELLTFEAAIDEVRAFLNQAQSRGEESDNPASSSGSGHGVPVAS